jgi:chemotaxis signal transduction protein
VILRVDGTLRFLPSSTVLRIAPPPRVTAVPGAPAELLGVSSYEGLIVPVIAIGAARREMMVCQHAGEVIGLVGGDVVHTGTFEVVQARPEIVDHDGQPAEAIDVPAIYSRVQASARPGRWVR